MTKEEGGASRKEGLDQKKKEPKRSPHEKRGSMVTRTEKPSSRRIQINLLERKKSEHGGD